MLEEEILPMFYDRTQDIPVQWVSFIKNCIADIAPEYTMKRMLDDYQTKFYDRLLVRSAQVRSDDYRLAREIDAWKSKMRSGWTNVAVKRVAVPDPAQRFLSLGSDFLAEVELKLNGIPAENLGIDIIFGQKEQDTVKKIIYKEEMKLVDSGPGWAKYSCKISMEKVGVYHYAFRLFPKSKYLAHRQDFPLMKWI